MQEGRGARRIEAEAFEAHERADVFSVDAQLHPREYLRDGELLGLFEHNREHLPVEEPFGFEHVAALLPYGEALREERAEPEGKQLIVFRLYVGDQLVHRVGRKRGEEVPSLLSAAPHAEDALQHDLGVAEVIRQPEQSDKLLLRHERIYLFIGVVQHCFKDFIDSAFAGD